jgi:hypothetical protein
MEDVLSKEFAVAEEELAVANEQFRPEASDSSVCKARARDLVARWLAKGTANSNSPRAKKARTVDQVATWPEDKMAASNTSSSHVDLSEDAAFLSEPLLIKLFVKYNTPVPAAVSTGLAASVREGIVRAEDSSISDKNFETFMFLKGNGHLVS